MKPPAIVVFCSVPVLSSRAFMMQVLLSCTFLSFEGVEAWRNLTMYVLMDALLVGEALCSGLEDEV